jgi:anti-sigma factor RsiW
MSERTPHLGDEIQAYLDGRLDVERQAEVRAHLADCEVCREELHRFEWLKGRLRSALADPAMPADLEQSIRALLDAPDRLGSDRIDKRQDGRTDARTDVGVRVRPWSVRPFIAAGVIVAALFALIIVGLSWWRLRPPTPAEIANDYVASTRGALPLDYMTPDTQALTRYFSEHGIAFRTRVFDFAMMQYTLVGGRVHMHRALASALFVYRGAHDERMICQMYVAPPPSAAPIARRTHHGIDFTVYRVGEVTLVFWEEDDGVTCVLSSNGDQEALVQLAFAKAERRPRT